MITLGARQVDVQRELHRLRVELEELRASRRRLVLAADADRRTIERDLHDGVHQHLISLAVSLQLAGQAEDSDPAALPALLAEMARAVHDGLEETARLAQRIHPATLEAGDLAALLRSASTAAGVPARVDVSAAGSYPPEAVMTIHLAWLDTLARAGAGCARRRSTCATRSTPSRSRSPHPGSCPPRISTACEGVSRPSAAGSRSRPLARERPSWRAHSRSNDDASRSLRGRERRP